MSASCPKVSFTLSSVSRECGRLCVPWLKTETGVTTKFFDESVFRGLERAVVGKPQIIKTLATVEIAFHVAKLASPAIGPPPRPRSSFAKDVAQEPRAIPSASVQKTEQPQRHLVAEADFNVVAHDMAVWNL